MSADESKPASTVCINPSLSEKEAAEKQRQATELFSKASRNYAVKSYSDAVDDLSNVCTIYEELYGDVCDQLGMPYLLYAKSLMALALEENKVIDVPDETEDEEESDDSDEKVEVTVVAKSNSETKMDETASLLSKNGVSLIPMKKKSDEAGSSNSAESIEASKTDKNSTATSMDYDEVPTTSNRAKGNADQTTELGEDENTTTMQLAWEILELANLIFERRGKEGLENLAEVKTELGNISFENDNVESARHDYEKAIEIHEQIIPRNRRALAELHFKIGLTYLTLNNFDACYDSMQISNRLIEGEINEILNKPELTEKDKANIISLKEIQQELLAKVTELEVIQAEKTFPEELASLDAARVALDGYIKTYTDMSAEGVEPLVANEAASKVANETLLAETTKHADKLASITASMEGAASTSKAASSSTSKPNNISHLIKRKNIEEPNSTTKNAAKRPAL